ncbi:MAG: hypothetical protein ACRDJC_03690 [Thermomicrobiales bacterium]
MIGSAFDAITRRAADVVSRRSSLRAMGGAALVAAAAAPTVTRAGKAGKRAKKKCKRQGRQCREAIPLVCAVYLPNNDPEQCAEFLNPCCDFLEKCQAAQYFTCFID